MEGGHKKSMVLVVLTSTLDKALATFMLANSAARMDMDVHIFFAFMGVGIVKKGYKPKLPGIFRFATGPYIKRLKKANVEDLDTQIEQARKLDVKMYVCSLCIQAELLKKERIKDGVKIAGFSTCVDLLNDSDTHLIIG